MKWACRHSTLRVVPPGFASCTVISNTWRAACTRTERVVYPTTLVGTEATPPDQRHRRVAWGVVNQAGPACSPTRVFLTPDVCLELKGKLRDGVTATDLVLTVTELLRREKVWAVLSNFLARHRIAGRPSRTDRQHGPGIRRDDGIFPGRRKKPSSTSGDRRTPLEVAGIRELLSRRRACRRAEKCDIRYSKVVSLDRRSRALARGPSGRRTGSKSAMSRRCSRSCFSQSGAAPGRERLQSAGREGSRSRSGPRADSKWPTATWLIAASRLAPTRPPSVLLARVAREKGGRARLDRQKHIRHRCTGLAIVTEYLTKTACCLISRSWVQCGGLRLHDLHRQRGDLTAELTRRSARRSRVRRGAVG